jgi:Mrp family chromosome partitioning ATPase
MADIALIVVGAGTTPAAAIQAAIDAMGRDRVLGVVLNRADPSLAAGGDYYYYYNGYYGDRDNASRRGGLFRRLLSRR